MFCKRWSCCFFLSAILTYTNRCRTVHSDKSSWKIPSNSGVCRGWLHFTNPKSGQFGRFPDSKPTFFEASLQQTQMLHNFSKHSWNKQFSGESIRVLKNPSSLLPSMMTKKLNTSALHWVDLGFGGEGIHTTIGRNPKTTTVWMYKTKE